MFDLILVDRRPDLCAAWTERFRGVSGVQVVRGPFETLPAFDSMVSPANSFGLMDGGVDAAITRFFGSCSRAAGRSRCGMVGTSVS